jgi:hypothetical protein
MVDYHPTHGPQSKDASPSSNRTSPEPLTLVRAAGCAGKAVQIRRSWASGRMALGARLGERAGGLMFGYVAASQSVISRCRAVHENESAFRLIGLDSHQVSESNASIAEEIRNLRGSERPTSASLPRVKEAPRSVSNNPKVDNPLHQIPGEPGTGDS